MADGLITTNAAEIVALLRANEKATTAALKAEAVQLKADLLTDYRKTTSTWSHSVSFDALADVREDGSFDVMVGTDDTIYGYVDQGTRAHTIVPKGPGYPLRFQRGYRAKTVAGVIGSKGGGKFGAETRAWSVRHPGTKARRFTQMIFDKHRAASLRRLADRLRAAWGG
jgi:hypothetical protein